MHVVTNRYDISGFPAGGGDSVAYVSITPPSFQAGQEVAEEFLQSIRDFFAAQQNVASVVVTKVETVSTAV